MPLSESPAMENLKNRVKNILLQPAAEWEKIDAEPTTLETLFKNYVAILAAVPAICGFIGGIVFGYNFLGVTVHPTFFRALSGAIGGYVLSFITIFVLGFIIDFLAPTFQGTKNQTQAFKVATYSMTAAWMAGIFSLIPSVGGLLGLLGLYSFYLLYLGLPKLMKVPADKAMAYTAVVVVVAIVFSVIVGNLVGSFTHPDMAEYGVPGDMRQPR